MKIYFGLVAHKSCFKCKHQRRVEEVYGGTTSLQFFCWAKAGLLFKSNNIDNCCKLYSRKYGVKNL